MLSHKAYSTKLSQSRESSKPGFVHFWVCVAFNLVCCCKWSLSHVIQSLISTYFMTIIHGLTVWSWQSMLSTCSSGVYGSYRSTGIYIGVSLWTSRVHWLVACQITGCREYKYNLIYNLIFPIWTTTMFSRQWRYVGNLTVFRRC